MAIVATDTSAESTPSLLPLWHRSVPQSLVDGCGDTLPLADWQTWQKYLANRKNPRATSFLSGHEPPLLWGVSGQLNSGLGVKELIANLDGGAGSNDTSRYENTGEFEAALACVGRAYALPQLAQEMPSEAWWSTVADLHRTAIAAEQISGTLQGQPEALVAQQLIAGELPYVLAYVLPELRALRELRRDAYTALSDALIEWTDGEGLPHGSLLPWLGPLWACWTRARRIGSRWKRGPWSREAEVQYQWLVRHAIRLTGPNGRFLLSNIDDSIPETTRDRSRGLFRAALAMAGDAEDHAAAIAALPEGTLDRQLERKFANHNLPTVSLNSEWSRIAVLATGWECAATRIALNWCADPVQVNLSLGEDQILTGDWTCQTTCDGEPVVVTGEWEQICWQSGKKCDYLELAIDLSHGLVLERQVILSRIDDALFIADAVLASNGQLRRLSHRSELPLAADAEWLAESETRDGVVTVGGRSVAVLPLALPEWRSDPRGGRLELQGGRLVLSQETTGQALYAPLFLDLKRKRSAAERTWRQLTVVEMLETVPSQLAVGFRAQSGLKQWLVYRSLGPAANRTVLGQNISSEFYVGRMKTSGKMKKWIEIEPVEEEVAPAKRVE